MSASSVLLRLNSATTAPTPPVTEEKGMIDPSARVAPPELKPLELGEIYFREADGTFIHYNKRMTQQLIDPTNTFTWMEQPKTFPQDFIGELKWEEKKADPLTAKIGLFHTRGAGFSTMAIRPIPMGEPLTLFGRAR